MEKPFLRAVQTDDWQLPDDAADSIPDSFDNEVMASLPGLPEGQETGEDWSGTLQLIGNASGALWAKDAENESLKAQIEHQKKVTLDEFQALHAQLKQARDETQRAHHEAAQAKKRALKAEAWLQQINDAVAAGFTPHLAKAPD